jgi:DnaK suppressor protein
MRTYESSLAGEFEHLLAQRERELCDILHAREAVREWGGGAAEISDFKDIAGGDTQAAVDEVQAELAAHELEQVLAARRRLQDRRYGECVDCGEPIDLRRLCALPATPYCTSCQEAHEHETTVMTRH